MADMLQALGQPFRMLACSENYLFRDVNVAHSGPGCTLLAKP